MKLPAVSAPAMPRRPGLVLTRGLRLLVASYAGVGVLGCAYASLSPGPWWWLAGWVAVVAVGGGLQALAAGRYGQPWVSPAYEGAAVVSWVSQWEAAGFACIGAVMMAVLIRAQRAADRQVAGGRDAVSHTSGRSRLWTCRPGC